MNREILFRGKRTDNGEWVYGSFIPDLLEVYGTEEQKGWTDWGFIKPFARTKEERQMQEVNRETVGQYTGLTDKNGVKIFEGDILKTRVYVHCKAAIVMYSEGCFWVHNPNGGNMPLFKYVDMESGKADDVEVIGNVFDNKLEE